MQRLTSEYEIESILWEKQIKAEISAGVTAKSLKNNQKIDLLRIFCFDPFDLENAKKEIKEKQEKLKNNQHIDHINRIIQLNPYQLILTYNSSPVLSTTIVKKMEKFSQQEIIDYSYQILSALNELHENNIIHGNIDLKHFFVTETGLKLRGFGLNSTTFPMDKSWNDKIAPGNS